MDYIYTLRATEGTTGFASCIPDPAPDLTAALELLAVRPLDTFLHRHALGLLLDALPEQWLRLGAACAREPEPTLAALLLELATLRQEAREVLAPFEPQLQEQARPWHEHTPETILIRPPLAENTRQGWHDNIHRHKAAPEAPPDTEAMLREKRRLDKTRGALARQRALTERLSAPEGEPEGCPSEFLSYLNEILEKNVPLPGQEMRHEASLSPIALLRPWVLSAAVAFGRNAHTLRGTAVAYGRGLKLAQARISCRMEIVERHCAHALVENDGSWGSVNGRKLQYGSWENWADQAVPAARPSALGAVPAADALPLRWLAGEDGRGEKILVPAQAVFLFCNLDEVTLFEHIGSTGLASGATVAAARLHALEEVLERYAHATTCFRAENCFELVSRDATIQSLLADYRWRGIKVQFQDITTELGLPAYRCFVQGKDGRVAQGTGAGLTGGRAALSALTETPWPYVWANPVPAPSGPGLADLPRRVLEELPDFSLGAAEADLALLEAALRSSALNPIYVDIGRPGIPFPVCRAFIPTLAVDTELESGPSATLLARSKYFPKGHNCA